MWSLRWWLCGRQYGRGGNKIRTREKGYKEHGFRDEKEYNDVLKYCQKVDFAYREELLVAAISANSAIASDLYYSVVNNLSYHDLAKIKYITATAVDFYAYRRACLANMRDWLRWHNIIF